MGRLNRWRQTVGLVLGPCLSIAVSLTPAPSLSLSAHRLAAVVVLVVVFWLTEAIPIPVTALLGAVLTVVCGIAPANRVLSAFGDPVIFLFIGSFMLARAMQVHRVDRRIAYTLLAHPWVGVSTSRSLWTLGLAACLMSMWISNTACVAMLFPVALAIARTTSELIQSPTARAGVVACTRYTTALLLMLSYAASVGGVATPVGTPPNLIGIALIREGVGVRIGFAQWMAFGVPLAFVLFVAVYGVLMLCFRPEVRTVPGQLHRMREAREALGSLSVGERNSLLAFGVAIMLWVGPGVLGLFLGAEHPLVTRVLERLPEGVAALLAASMLFCLPTNWQRREFTLNWDEAVRIDWGTVLLFGGGIALGRLMFETGLAESMGIGLLGVLGIRQPAALTGASAAIATLISETSSNTASANMVIPVMLAAVRAFPEFAIRIGVAATMGASMGFMFPISTPPNAIVYGSGAVRITDMLKAGLLLDVIGCFIIWGACLWLVPLIVK